MEKRILITSALPYVNNEPHLGNLVQMLSADVFARYSRLTGKKTLYVGGTDEYGTATETRAIAEGTTPRALCDRYFEIHKKIYDWFEIKCDIFGRTSNSECTETTQEIFKDLDANGLIDEKETTQLFCPKCNMFLADRFVAGKCPHCGGEARGDQCEKCGALLDPVELKEPHCATCGEVPQVRKTKHLYINLPKLKEPLSEWVEKAAVQGRWADNAVSMTRAWIRDGLNERAITRDLKWGIPVPRAGYENKVFYVWFNAPIGYISMTRQLQNELALAGNSAIDWKEWWQGDEVKLFQFIGKDNIPFHTVIFPCTLIGTGKKWTKLFHMSSTEFLNYEDKKFSKSHGVGVFGTDAIESGIKADQWRFYVYWNRPEKADFCFTWRDFMEQTNATLVGNLGNLVNRTLVFVSRYYGGLVPEGAVDKELLECVHTMEEKVTEALEWAQLRDAFREIFAISDAANKAFQAGEPWKTRNTAPEAAARLIRTLCLIIRDISIMLCPFMPDYAQSIAGAFGKRIAENRIYEKAEEGSLTWADIGKEEGIDKVNAPEVYFKPMDEKTCKTYREKYSGKQDSREAHHGGKACTDTAPAVAIDQKAHFNAHIELRVAVVKSVERNPDSDKLYIEHLDDGTGEERIIQSGLVPYLKEEEIVGQHIILAANLAPRKMRGVTSRGMLLAADYKGEDGEDKVELVTAPWAEAGTPVVLEGADANAEKDKEISADGFFKVLIEVKDRTVGIDGTALTAGGKALVTQKTVNGEVH